MGLLSSFTLRLFFPQLWWSKKSLSDNHNIACFGHKFGRLTKSDVPKFNLRIAVFMREIIRCSK